MTGTSKPRGRRKVPGQTPLFLIEDKIGQVFEKGTRQGKSAAP